MILAFGASSYLLAHRVKDTDRSKSGFLVASRSLGWRPASLSIAATWIWAPSLFVAAEQAYLHGWVGVFWFTVPNVACLVGFAWFAQRMRSRHPGGFTLSGYVRQRLSVRAQRVYLVALGGLAVCSFAVQLLAGGLIVASVSGLPYPVVTLLLASIAVAYSLRSGLRGSVVTDYLQMGVIGLVALVLAPWVGARAGWDVTVSGLSGVGGDHTSLFTGAGADVFWVFGLSTAIGLLSGPFGDQSFWQRAWSIREGQVKRAFVTGAAVFAVVPLSMSVLGFAVAGAGIEVEDTQLTNLEAVLRWLPSWAAVPFLLFVLCGLVSTLDSNLVAVGSLAGHDLARSDRPDHVVGNARAGMVLLAAVATALANVPGLTVTGLFIFYGTLRASTLVPTVLLLSWRRPVHEAGVFWGVLLSLVVGIPVSAYGNLTGSAGWTVAGSVLVIVLSALVTALVSVRRAGDAHTVAGA